MFYKEDAYTKATYQIYEVWTLAFLFNFFFFLFFDLFFFSVNLGLGLE